MRELIVIKLGGGTGIDHVPTCRDIAHLVAEGARLVFVHGGSAETTRVAEALGHPPEFITSPSGHTSRRTDRETLDIFQMVYCGLINKRIVACLRELGINAVGLSGIDGGLWTGVRRSAIRSVRDGRTTLIRDDLSGRVERVESGLLTMLLETGHVPVLTPPAVTEDGIAINVDADRAAALTAGTLGATRLVMLSNVPGLLRDVEDASSVVPEVALSNAEAFERLARGRMKTKLLAAREALELGVERAVIGAANIDEPVRHALAGGGTQVVSA